MADGRRGAALDLFRLAAVMLVVHGFAGMYRLRARQIG